MSGLVAPVCWYVWGPTGYETPGIAGVGWVAWSPTSVPFPGYPSLGVMAYTSAVPPKRREGQIPPLQTPAQAFPSTLLSTGLTATPTVDATGHLVPWKRDVHRHGRRPATAYHSLPKDDSRVGINAHSLPGLCLTHGAPLQPVSPRPVQPGGTHHQLQLTVQQRTRLYEPLCRPAWEHPPCHACLSRALEAISIINIVSRYAARCPPLQGHPLSDATLGRRH